LHHPKILFLDEPTVGLDPQTRNRLWEYVKKVNKEEKMTVFLTTHYMEEAEVLCDRIAIMEHGKIIEDDKPAALIAGTGKFSRMHKAWKNSLV
jgi:ABC-2 type transport system ATP-binding protein